jgi:hypothetical protein
MSMNGHFRVLSPALVARVKEDPGAVLRQLRAEDPRQLDIHKAWHGLHYLLTGKADDADGPLGFVATGGERVGDDLGYGPARLFDPDAVKTIAAALDALTVEEVAARYDADKMTELHIYPGGWGEKESRWRGALIQHFDEVRALIRDAARDGLGMLVYLT